MPSLRGAPHAFVVAAIAIASCGPSSAAERLVDRLQGAPGLPAGISDVAQDETGFLWVSSEEGLFRYDGSHFQPWGKASERTRLEWVVAGAGDRVVAGTYGGFAYERVGDGTAPVLDRDGKPMGGVSGAAIDPRGGVWLIRDEGGVRYRDPGGTWGAVDRRLASAGIDYPAAIVVRREGGVLVGTRRGEIWSVDPSGNAERIEAFPGSVVQHLVEDSDGSIVANVRFAPSGGIYRISGRRSTRLVGLSGRPTGLALRDGAIWSSWDDGVVTVSSQGRIQRLGPADGFVGGGHLFVDREDDLWATGFDGGLHRYPEPDTTIWTESAGLPHGRLRGIVPTEGGMWASSWAGALYYDGAADAWRPVETGRYTSSDAACGIGGGGILTGGYRNVSGADEKRTMTLLRGRGRRAAAVLPEAPRSGEIACAPSVDGGDWAVYGGRLYRVAPEGPLVDIAPAPERVSDLAEVADGAKRELIGVGRDGSLCRRPAVPDAGRAWSCSALPDAIESPRDVARIGDRLWIASFSGVWEEKPDGGFRRLLGKEVLGTDAAVGLTPSARGGMWVVGRVAAVRAVPAAEGAEVVERLTPSDGLPRWWLSDVHEMPAGDLWVTSLGGIAHIPAEARLRETSAVPVTVTTVAVGGTARNPSVPLRAVAGAEPVEVRWAALTFRDRSRLRFRARVGPDRPWIETEIPLLRLTAPGSGKYAIEVQASGDGEHWTSAAARIDLSVVPPWYLRAWVWALCAAILLAFGLLAYRVRIAHLLRLERQRTEIAMDLHDEIGAGLGSIGLLAELAGDASVPGAERTAIAGRIARQAKTLGGSVADIVWSLRSGAETLDALVLALRERAAELAPDGAIAVSFDAPDPVPPIRLSLPVRRHAQWIVVEAVRNAVRHSGAGAIRVSLAPDGAGWRLVVEDDGRGIEATDAPRIRGGVGRESMERRAAAIGGRLEILSSSSGTRVALTFRPGGRRPRMNV